MVSKVQVLDVAGEQRQRAVRLLSSVFCARVLHYNCVLRKPSCHSSCWARRLSCEGLGGVVQASRVLHMLHALRCAPIHCKHSMHAREWAHLPLRPAAMAMP